MQFEQKLVTVQQFIMMALTELGARSHHKGFKQLVLVSKYKYPGNFMKPDKYTIEKESYREPIP